MVEYAPRRIVLDVDSGIDDAIAILLAFRSPELLVEAITVVAGSVPVDLGAENVLRLVSLAGRPEVPVVKGARSPLLRKLLTSEAIHGENGLGGATLPEPKTTVDPRHAVDFLIELITKNPGEITLVTVGPLTNVALALRREPGLVPKIPEIILMGGSLSGGNVTAQAEFNIYCDAEAAKIVFNSGIPITMVHLGVTSQAVLTRQHLEQLASRKSPVGMAVAEMAKHYIGIYEARGLPGGSLHDPLAVGLVIDKSLVKQTERMYIDVETKGELTYGETVANRRLTIDTWTEEGDRLTLATSKALEPNTDVPILIDGERFVTLLLERLSAPR